MPLPRCPVCEKSVDVWDLGLCLLHVRLLRATSKTTTTVRATLRTRGHGSLLSNGGSAAAASLHFSPKPEPGPEDVVDLCSSQESQEEGAADDDT